MLSQLLNKSSINIGQQYSRLITRPQLTAHDKPLIKITRFIDYRFFFFVAGEDKVIFLVSSFNCYSATFLCG